MISHFAKIGNKICVVVQVGIACEEVFVPDNVHIDLSARTGSSSRLKFGNCLFANQGFFGSSSGNFFVFEGLGSGFSLKPKFVVVGRRSALNSNPPGYFMQKQEHLSYSV